MFLGIIACIVILAVPLFMMASSEDYHEVDVVHVTLGSWVTPLTRAHVYAGTGMVINMSILVMTLVIVL